KNTSPSVQCVFMFGVSPIEMIVEIALSLLAVMCNFHNHFCPAELLQILKEGLHRGGNFYYNTRGFYLYNLAK
ncbi:MAG: hypothetical protein IIY81_01990, partial [Lachnospiraceae bacterium]|nr:hypothetical protein [Lachnospiraceae bacterium]